MSYKIYKGDDVVVEGDSPLIITGISPNTDVAAGDYQAVRVDGENESDRVDIPAFKTLPIVVTGVAIAPKTVTLEIGETQQLTSAVTPTNATDKTVSYASKAQGIAGVDANGLITAKVAGETEIVVSTTDGDKKDTCTVTVKEPVVDVAGVTLSPKTSTGESGAAGTRQLTATVAPSDATNKAVTYAIAPTTTALTVSNAGLISWTAAVAAGAYTTTVTTTNGTKKDTHVLTLTEPEPEPEEGD